MKTIYNHQAIARLPAAQRIAIGRQVISQVSATHQSRASEQRVHNPFVDPEAFLTARRIALQSHVKSKSVEINHVE